MNIIIFSANPLTNHSIRMLTFKNLILWSNEEPLFPSSRIIHNWSPTLTGLVKLLFLTTKSRINKNININLQHEFNVYGGPLGLLFVPLILILNPSITLTLHSYIRSSNIDKNFLRRFGIGLPLFLSKLAFSFFFTSVVKFSNKIYVHSKEQYNSLSLDYPGFKSKFILNHIGIDYAVSNIADRREFLLEESYDFLIFGYIAPRKGIENVLNAIKLLNQTNVYPSLLICGFVQDKNMDYYNEIKTIICNFNLNVKIIPGIEDVYVDSLFSQVKCVLFPYHDVLGASGPLGFAIANRVPYIAVNKGIFADYPLSNSILIQDNQPESLAVAMHSFIQGDRLDNTKEIDDLIRKVSWINYAKKSFI